MTMLSRVMIVGFGAAVLVLMAACTQATPAATPSTTQQAAGEAGALPPTDGPRITEALAIKQAMESFGRPAPEIMPVEDAHDPVARLMRLSEYEALRGGGIPESRNSLVWVVEAEGAWSDAGIVPVELRTTYLYASAAIDAQTGAYRAGGRSNEPVLGRDGQASAVTPTPTLTPTPTPDEVQVVLRAEPVEGSVGSFRFTAKIYGELTPDMYDAYCSGATWDFGDGEAVSTSYYCSSTTWRPGTTIPRVQEQTHTYAEPGTFTVTFYLGQIYRTEPITIEVR